MTLETIPSAKKQNHLSWNIHDPQKDTIRRVYIDDIQMQICILELTQWQNLSLTHKDFFEIDTDIKWIKIYAYPRTFEDHPNP